MKEKFCDVNFKKPTARLLSKIQEIVVQYQGAGYRLTLRQLYYQLVAHDIIPNRKNEYAKISSILTQARMGGLVDWTAIEDRVRIPKMHSEWDDIAGLVESACSSYRLPRWSDQDHYVEMWTEKDAIAGILSPITEQYHIHLVVNRGYSSASAMYDASKRFLQNINNGKAPILLYLGDFDPSGLDMDRDIKARLKEFGVENLFYQRIGLTWDQIQEFHPPPNPAKISDPRAKDYIEQYGESSWEVDALNPETLNTLVVEAILGYLNIGKYNAWIEKEHHDEEALRDAAHDILESDEEE